MTIPKNGTTRRIARRLAIVGVVGAAALAAAGCSGNQSTTSSLSAGASVNPQDLSGTLRLFSYSDGFAPAYIAPFTQQYPNINLVKEPFGNGDEAVLAPVHRQERRCERMHALRRRGRTKDLGMTGL